LDRSYPQAKMERYMDNDMKNKNNATDSIIEISEPVYESGSWGPQTISRI